ncbi:MAG: L,D-transpeptidase [Armatimonadota bacterium]
MRPGNVLAAIFIVAAMVLLVTAATADVLVLKPGEPVPRQLAEGKTYDITWTSDGLSKVSVEAMGNLISRPGAPRGRFDIVIGEDIPAKQGKVTWLIPFLDTIRFTVYVNGYSSEGQLMATDSKDYLFRPEILRNRTANGIYVDLRNPDRQRLYRMHNNIVTNAYLTSGSRSGVFLTKYQDSPMPHDHVGVFRITYKNPMYWSNEYQVWMTHAMNFWKGHFIHGTYPSEYRLLGHPASSGCIRLDRTDAKELYDITPIGTRVEIFGNR